MADTQIIEVPGLGQVEFPSDTPTHVMESSIKQALVAHHAQLATPEPKKTVGGMLEAGARSGLNKFMTEAGHGGEQIVSGLGRAMSLNPVEIAKGLGTAGLGVAQVVGSPFAGYGEAAGESVRQATEPLGPNASAAAATAANLGAQLYGVPTTAATYAPGPVKGVTQAAGKLVAPNVTRKAGVEAAMENLGAEGNAVTRSYQVPGSQALYQAAESKPPLNARIPANQLAKSAAETPTSIPGKEAISSINKTRENIFPTVKKSPVEPAANMADYLVNKQKATDAYLEALRKRPNSVGWKKVIDEAQDLRNQAHNAFEAGESVKGDALRSASDKLINKLGSINPTYAKANQAYLREHGINKVADILARPDPGQKLGSFFQKDPMLRSAFDPKEAKMVERIADQLSTMSTSAGSSGLMSRTINFVATPIASAMRTEKGRQILRESFKDGPVSPKGLQAVATLLRARESYQSEE